MATTKMVILEALEELLEKEFKDFKWRLSIPRGCLEKADVHDVVDLMVQHYTEADAGKIAVRTLCNMKQIQLANRLKGELQKVLEDVPAEAGSSSSGTPEPAQTAGVTVNITSNGGSINAPVVHVLQSEPVDRRNASMSVRPHSITPSSQEFKTTILSENRNNVYIPKDKSQRKRSALLITNIRFKHLRDRPGAERDEENMEWLLTCLGYSVEKYTDLTGTEIDSKVKDFAACSKHQDSDSTFVVLMSHGDRIQNKDAILGVNYDEVGNPDDFFFVDDVISHLNSKRCPALIDKPKVILIQACRGEHTGAVDIQSDSVVHIEKDFVCFKSCLPDIVALRHRSNGSYFIVYIMEVFCKQAHVDDIVELFRKVTLSMEKDTSLSAYRLMPCIDRMSLPKKLYLFPGL